MQDLYDEGDVNKSPEMTNVSFIKKSGHLQTENLYMTDIL